MPWAGVVAMSSSNQDAMLTRPLAVEDWQELVDAWEMPDFSVDTPDEPDNPDDGADPVVAEEVVAARAEAEKAGFEAGQQKGRDLGYQDGMAAAREEIEQLENRLRGWLSHLEAPLQLMDEEVTEQLTALATQIARVMVAREVQADASALAEIAREALSALPVSARAVTLRCAPADEPALRELLDAGRFTSLDLRADPGMDAGGVIAESGDARVDASLANRWATTLDHLIGRVYPGPDQPVEAKSDDVVSQGAAETQAGPAEPDAQTQVGEESPPSEEAATPDATDTDPADEPDAEGDRHE